MMKNYTNEQKEKILEMMNYECIVGYMMPYGAPESDNVIISLDDVNNIIIGKEPKKYWFPKGWGDQVYEIDDVWEYVLDDVADAINADDDSKIEDYIDHKLAEYKASNKDKVMNNK